jgi:hypothetical protein
VERTAQYINQNDIHFGELTVQVRVSHGCPYACAAASHSQARGIKTPSKLSPRALLTLLVVQETLRFAALCQSSQTRKRERCHVLHARPGSACCWLLLAAVLTAATTSAAGPPELVLPPDVLMPAAMCSCRGGAGGEGEGAGDHPRPRGGHVRPEHQSGGKARGTSVRAAAAAMTWWQGPTRLPPSCCRYMEAVGEHYRLAADIAIKGLGLEGCADTLVVSAQHNESFSGWDAQCPASWQAGFLAAAPGWSPVEGLMFMYILYPSPRRATP